MKQDYKAALLKKWEKVEIEENKGVFSVYGFTKSAKVKLGEGRTENGALAAAASVWS